MVNAVTFPTGDDFNKPDDGKKFVAVDLSVTNNSAESQAISSLIQMDLKDATGQVYDVDFTASLAAGGASPDGELAPGESCAGRSASRSPRMRRASSSPSTANCLGAGRCSSIFPINNGDLICVVEGNAGFLRGSGFI